MLCCDVKGSTGPICRPGAVSARREPCRPWLPGNEGAKRSWLIRSPLKSSGCSARTDVLKRKLEQAESMLDIQKKASEMMGISLRTSRDEDES